jgi:hypothetical protein
MGGHFTQCLSMFTGGPASRATRIRPPDPVVRSYALAAASHSWKVGPASFAPGLGSAPPFA